VYADAGAGELSRRAAISDVEYKEDSDIGGTTVSELFPKQKTGCGDIGGDR